MNPPVLPSIPLTLGRYSLKYLVTSTLKMVLVYLDELI